MDDFDDVLISFLQVMVDAFLQEGEFQAFTMFILPSFLYFLYSLPYLFSFYLNSLNSNTTGGGSPFAPGPGGFESSTFRVQLCKSIILLSALLLSVL